MIHCLSCKKYLDSKNIPYGSSFSTNVYKVNLISKNTPNNFDIDGSDVEELPDDCKFADGSKLYIVNGIGGSNVYVYDSDKFVPYPIETKTVSGVITSFNDATNLPLKSLIVDINPIQDLNGYDHPWVAGGGKNLFNKDTVEIGIWIDAHGEITDNVGCGVSAKIPVVSNSDYTAFKHGTDTIYSFSIVEYDSNDTFIKRTHQGVTDSPLTVTTTGTTSYVKLQISRSNNTTPLTTDMLTAYKFMLEVGSSASSDYVPYENICPISGWTGMNVSATGKNLFNKTATDTDNGYVEQRYIVSSGAVYKPTDTKWSVSEYIPVKPDTTYTLSGLPTANSPSICEYDSSKTYVKGTNYASASSKTLTTESNTAYIRVSIYADNIDTMQIEVGSSATSYEAYTLNKDISLSFGQTVYGGSLDVLSGVLTVKYMYADMGDYNWSTPSSAGSAYVAMNDVADAFGATSYDTPYIIADAFNVVPHATFNSSVGVEGYFLSVNANQRFYIMSPDFVGMSKADLITWLTGYKIAFRLATPTTYQLTAQEVSSLLGDNNIYADCGDTTVEYRAYLT